MRTTVNIDDGVLRDAKRLAESRRISLGYLVDEALAMLLAHHRKNPKPGGPVDLPVFEGEPGLQPGVDLGDKEALMELLDLPDLPEDASDARAAG